MLRKMYFEDDFVTEDMRSSSVVTTTEVFYDEPDTFSGLYDMKGNPLHRKSEKIKLGFDLGNA